MSGKTTFKGFTFKKSSGQFVPPPPAPKASGISPAQASLAGAGVSKPWLNSTRPAPPSALSHLGPGNSRGRQLTASSNSSGQQLTSLSSGSGRQLTASSTNSGRQPTASSTSSGRQRTASSTSSAFNASRPYALMQSLSGTPENVSDGGKNVQTSVRTFFNPPSARPVATVTPQGHSSNSGSDVGGNRGPAGASQPLATTVFPSTSSSSNGLKRKRTSEAPAVTRRSAPIFADLNDDDDDDFDMPIITPASQRRSPHTSVKTSEKENTEFSDDEIVPVRKRGSMVLQSDDDDDGMCNDFDDALLSTTPTNPASASQGTRHLPSASNRAQFLPSPIVATTMRPSPSFQASSSPSMNQRSSSQAYTSTAADHTNQFSALDRGSGEGTVSSETPCGVSRGTGAQLFVGLKKKSDVTKHPLLTTDAAKLSADDVSELQSLLLTVADEVCDIICSASTDALMNLGLEGYGRLQVLLAVRKQIKDKEKASTATPPTPTSSRRLSDKFHTPRPSTSANFAGDGGGCQLMSPPVAASTAVKKVPAATVTPGDESPVPCGDSFFDDVGAFTQSHMTYMRAFKTPTGPTTTTSPAANASPLLHSRSGFQGDGSLPGQSSAAVSPGNAAGLLHIREEVGVHGDRPSPLHGQSSSYSSSAAAAGSLGKALGFLPLPGQSLGSVVSAGERSEAFRSSYQDSPIVLSQNSSLGAAGDSEFNEPVRPVPILDKTRTKRPVAASATTTMEDMAFEDQFNENMEDVIASEFEDNNDYGFCDADLESGERQVVARVGGSNPVEIIEERQVVARVRGSNPAGLTEERQVVARGGGLDPAEEVPGVSDPYLPTFGSSDKDDGATGEFDGEGFEHSEDLRSLFRNIFGLREFRHNQLQAMNSAILGNDCFILMPTGGGKSLCYQLPACVKSGVSIIVSPLRALIQDQVTRLISLDIPAAHLSGDIDMNQANNVYSSLYQRQPGIKLLYVTPEKLSASEKLLSCLDSLYRRQMLDRFVIDEAHCVSQWGHDFRPDYKKLNALRCKFPGVPIMALTATATPRVRRDIIHQLSMSSPKWFMQSFNRPNLKYVVRTKKPSNTASDIIEIVKSKFKRECGIVYCLSRKECDTMADKLQGAGIMASAYHAGLSDGDRVTVQERWLNGDNCKVICATIAFGMGIDKADVRFVIHYSLPKSVEGYYQEAGRAGRDGQIAHCVLFYNYSDVKRLRRIIDMDQNATYDSKRVHIDNLFRMVQYCENLADCRRAQVLHYFGEHHFDRSRCNIVPGAVCDNCGSKDMFKVRDVTEDAQEVVRCVRELTSNRRSNFTLLHFVEIFKGSKNSRIMDAGHNRLALHGRGAAYTRGDAERLMHKLVIEGALLEELKITAADTAACYVRLGPKAAALMQNTLKIELAVQGGKVRSEAGRIGSEPQTNRQQLVEDCYKELVTLAKTIATEHGSKNYALIFPNAMLWQLAEKTPLTVEEMKRDIDGLPETKINKYGAHRFTEVTTKYCVMLAALQEDEDENSQTSTEQAGDWASPYFDNGSTSAGTGARGKKPFGRGRGGKSRGGKRGRGGGKKSSSTAKRGAANSGRGGGSTAKGGRGGGFSRGRGGGGSSTRGGGASGGWGGSTSSSFSGGGGGGGRKPSSTVTKSSLGLMPDPRARSYLASVGSYMG